MDSQALDSQAPDSQAPILQVERILQQAMAGQQQSALARFLPRPEPVGKEYCESGESG